MTVYRPMGAGVQDTNVDAGYYFNNNSITNTNPLGTSYTGPFTALLSFSQKNYGVLYNLGTVSPDVGGVYFLSTATDFGFFNLTGVYGVKTPITNGAIYTAVGVYDGTLSMWLNGVKAGVPYATAALTLGNLGSSLGKDIVGTASTFQGAVYRHLLLNYALSEDKIRRYSAGAKLDYEDVGGSMVELFTNGALTSGAGWGINGNITLSSNTAVASGATGSVATLQQSMTTPPAMGKRCRLSFDVTSKTNASAATVRIAGSTLSSNALVITGTLLPIVAAGSRQSIEFIVEGTGTRTVAGIEIQGMIAGDSITIDNLSLIQLGAVLDLEPENITDTTWVDASPNGLHGTVSGAVANRFVPSYSSRNYIINGAMDFSQRGINFSVNNAYALDRFWISHDVTSGTVVQLPDTSVIGANACRLGVFTRGGGTGIHIFQSLETQNAQLLAGKKVVLSAYLAKDSNFNAGQVRFHVRTSANVDEKFPSTAVSSVYFQNSDVAVGSYVRLSAVFDIPAGTKSLAVSIGMHSLTANVPDGSLLYVKGLMLNEGPTAAPFERAGGSIGEELALCERYFQQFYSSLIATYPSMRPEVVVPNSIYANFPLRTRMRPTASPVLYTNSPVLGVDYLVVNLAGVAQSGFTLNASIQASECHVRFQLDKTTHGLTDAAVLINSTKIGVSAEL
jgi:hypothetical protein